MRALANITIILLACSILIGCKSRIQYVPVESVRTEYRDKYLRDSIHVYDSIHITDKGDTVIIEKHKYIYKDKLRTDTVAICDSIPYPVEVPVKGDTIYKMKWYEEIVFYIGLASLLLGLVYGGFRWVKKKFF